MSGKRQGPKRPIVQRPKHKDRPAVGRGKYVKAPTLTDKVTKPRWIANAALNNRASTVALGGLGAAAAIQGATRHSSKKTQDRADIASGALAGGSIGEIGRNQAGYHYKRQAKASAKEWSKSGRELGPYSSGPHKAKLRALATEAGKYARTKTADGSESPRHKMQYFNDHFPKDVPGYKPRAAMKLIDNPKVAAPVIGGAALIGGGAAALKNHFDHKVHKRMMSDAEIRRRKKLQGHISMGTGALGLAALGGTLAAGKKFNPKLIGGLKRIGMANPEKHFGTEALKSKVEPVLATSAGLGGAGSFNFASYTSAESKKRKAPVMKNAPSPFEDGYYGAEGIAKYYDPEAQREKRANQYQGAATVVAGGGGALTAHHAWKAGEAAQKMKPQSGILAQPGKGGKGVLVQGSDLPGKFIRLDSAATKALKHHGKRAALAGGVTAAAAYGAKKISDKKKGSWSSYVGKSAESGFGVVHD